MKIGIAVLFVLLASVFAGCVAGEPADGAGGTTDITDGAGSRQPSDTFEDLETGIGINGTEEMGELSEESVY